ncbi:MAG: hypothetical protein QF619_10485, partial [Candidatus Binatia bacterium]|nr:hypothetical protein [Candidatus Binatia bacterium]
MSTTYAKTYRINDRELDAVELKTELSIEGVRIDPAACQGVGTIYKEQVHGQFDFDEDFHREEKLPEELNLPDGTLITLKASRSPYLIRRDNGQLAVEANGESIIEISFEPRPRFNDRRTSDGILMHRVGQLMEHHCVIFDYSTYAVSIGRPTTSAVS